MDTSEAISVVAFLTAAATLASASFLDIKTRQVPNSFWIFLSLTGVTLILLRLVADEEKLEYLMVLLPIAAILSDVYLDSDGDSSLARMAPFVKYGVAVIMTILLWLLWGDDRYFQHLLAVPLMMMVFVGMYILDILKGGADAKALIALSILFPFHPVIGDLPLIAPVGEYADILFPFALAVLIDAAIIVVFLPLVFLVRNLTSRDFRLPQMLLGYTVDASSGRPGFVWLMERIEDGRHIFYTRPRSDENLETELLRLRDYGRDRVWVTPKIPFIVPILAGLFLATVAGNILFALF